ncbi:MAG: adenosylcobinamide-phosphate synthase CbiB [Maritimibacter sp.]
MSTVFVLFLALILDAILGEPDRIWSRVPHPAVLMGRAVGWCEARMNHGAGRVAAGVMALVILMIGAWVFGGLLARLGGAVSVVVAAILIAQKSLVQHVEAVADALAVSPEDGRRKVALIVGRDTAHMTQSDVARAAIESGAENLSDGVIAPAFWFLVAGLPGLLVYKIVNTADSMIGYRTPRYEAFGKAAARTDDLLNWVPARLTALLILAPQFSRAGWGLLRRDAPLHRSPNAGWPEAAMAARLNVALSGPRRYEGELRDFPYVNAQGTRDLDAAHVDEAVRVLWQAWAIALLGVGLLSLL